MAHNEKNSTEAIEKIRELIKGVRIAMLTTVDEDGTLRSRPMATQDAKDFDGDVWFFTEAGSAKMNEVARERQVNVSYSNPDDQVYVSLSGPGVEIRDRARIKELWNPGVKAWFPDGPDGPRVTLLRVKVEKAEYWDSPSAKMVQLAGFLKAVITGERLDYAGENEKLDLVGTAAVR